MNRDTVLLREISIFSFIIDWFTGNYKDQTYNSSRVVSVQTSAMLETCILEWFLCKHYAGNMHSKFFKDDMVRGLN